MCVSIGGRGGGGGGMYHLGCLYMDGPEAVKRAGLATTTTATTTTITTAITLTTNTHRGARDLHPPPA